MTFLSTLFALAMMPMWLYILAPFYINVERIAIPKDIVIQLAIFVVPTLIGIAVKTWKPASKARKCVSMFRECVVLMKHNV